MRPTDQRRSTSSIPPFVRYGDAMSCTFTDLRSVRSAVCDVRHYIHRVSTDRRGMVLANGTAGSSTEIHRPLQACVGEQASERTRCTRARWTKCHSTIGERMDERTPTEYRSSWYCSCSQSLDCADIAHYRLQHYQILSRSFRS